MRKQAGFRPRVAEALEERVVPSRAGVSAAVAPASPQTALTARIRGAFSDFEQSLIQAINVDLVLPAYSGAAAFGSSTQALALPLQQGLTTLARDLARVLGETPAEAAVAGQVRQAILGPARDSLRSRLDALTTASVEQGASIYGYTNAVRQAIAEVFARVNQEALAALPAVAAPAGTAATQAPAPSSAKAVQGVRAAFASFLDAGLVAVHHTLLAPRTDGTVDPAANRPAFDARVDAALQALAAGLAADLGHSPAVAALAARTQAAIVGDGPDSLRGRLAALPTPTGAQPAQVRAFTLATTRTIGQALAQVAGDVARSLRGPQSG